ncbi:MAG: hypothetical protein Q4G45_11500 [Actinomycetia bacterium]|nr:hypothetical protein [Actinomycetes bacterium]
MTVTVTAEVGTVTIVPDGWVEPGSPVRVAPLEVTGGVVTVPAESRGDDLPYALLLDPVAAGEWLAEVYGGEVAAVCQELRHGQSAEVVAVASGTTWAVTDLARACWLDRWWPSATVDLPGLEQAALDLDLGLLAGRAGGCVQTEAADRLARGVRGLARVSALVSGLTGARRERADRLLREAVEIAAYVLEGTAEGEAAAAYQERSDAQDAEVGRLLAEWPAEPQVPLVPAAPFAGGEPTHPRTQTVDWLQIPARSVSGDEGNVTIEATGEGLTITVEAGDHPVSRIHARLYGADLPVIVALDHQPGRRCYTGTTGPDPGGRVDIADLGRPVSQLVAPRPEPVAADDRCLVRQVLRARLGPGALRPLLAELVS